MSSTWQGWLKAQEEQAARQAKRSQSLVDLRRLHQLDVQELINLRRLLAEERALRQGVTSPWLCNTSGCPFQGKPMNRHCRCYAEAVAAHDKAVARKLTLGGGDDRA